MPENVDAQLRLDRLLAALALGSRSQVREMVRAGRVRVNGALQRSPQAHVMPGDCLLVDDAPVDARLTRHIMLYKPCGVLTAARDPKQPTVLDLLPSVYRACGCMPAGRLDKDTEGLLLLTTDGTLAHLLLSPKRHVWKSYIAVVDGPLGANDVAAFADGIALSDFTALPARLEILSSSNAQAAGRVWVHEGKFHQVRRMFAARGRTVTSLKRETFGPLVLDAALRPGEYRELTQDERNALYACASSENEAT